MIRRLLKLVVTLCVIAVAATSTVQAKHQDSTVLQAQHVIAFFQSHPKQAATPAGQLALQKAADRIAFGVEKQKAAAKAAAAREVASRYAAEREWVNGSFATCVRWRESGNGTASQNIYEIQGPHASRNYGDYEWLYGVSRATQDHIAYEMFLKYGVSPWRPYDGC